VISCANRIDIGKNVLIADRCCVLDSEHDYKDISRPILLQKMTEGAVKIEDDCWIGINVVILPDVTIGRHSVIGANSVVTMNVPQYSVVCGIPARVIKQYDSKEGKWIPAKDDVLGKGTS
jgi:acetyltransferase-like isoleucine patch superfamily enzyme